jgi:UDPglucose 6-dehydrogenase
MEQAAKLLENVTYCGDAYEALEGAHAAVIVTEWDTFRALDFERMKGLLAESLLVDLRNLYNRKEVERHGFRYVTVGRELRPAQAGPTNALLSLQTVTREINARALVG